MDITITGRHVTIDADVRSYIQAKLERIRRIFNRVTAVSAVIEVENGSHVVELLASLPRATPISVRFQDGDLRRSIDGADQKLEARVRAYKERLRRRRS